jgi:hypothetical protein
MGYKKLNKAIELAKAEGLPYEFSCVATRMLLHQLSSDTA